MSLKRIVAGLQYFPKPEVMLSMFVSVSFFNWHVLNVKLESDGALKKITLKEICSSVELCYFAGSLNYSPWVLGTFHLLKIIVTCNFSTKYLFHCSKE